MPVPLSVKDRADTMLIPRAVVSAAVVHAQANRVVEVGGMFALCSDGQVRYLPGANVSSEPSSSIELSAEWIASQYAAGRTPIAFFHSHPGGRDQPSDDDITGFPYHYVGVCFIYYGENNKLVAYDNSEFSIVTVGDEGLYVEWEG